MDRRQIMELYDAHARDLVGYFAWRTRDPHVALDLVADTFPAAIAGRDRCRAGSECERAAWLYRIASNELTDHFRRRAIERRALSRIGGAPGTDRNAGERSDPAGAKGQRPPNSPLHLRPDRLLPEQVAARGERPP